jgi:hypothetical protein
VFDDGVVFEDFVAGRRRAADLDLFVRHGGSGPAVVLAHMAENNPADLTSAILDFLPGS